MLVPGSNLLSMALGVIGSQGVQWLKYQGKITNSAGFDVPTWAPAVPIAGSLQPADPLHLQQLGLDMTKQYVMFYATAEFTQVDRDQTGDRLIYAGKTYQVLAKTSWFAQDGWERPMCVEVDPNA